MLGHPIEATEYAEVIAGLNGRRLLQLDSALWLGSYEAAEAKAVILQLADAPDRAVTLFVAGCDSSGYAREAAVRAMCAYPGPVALSLALLRADDHVPQVRDAALVLLASVLHEIPARALFDRLDLVFALRARSNFDAYAWPTMHQILLDARSSDDRWAAARNGTQEVRRCAWRLMAQADTEVIDARLADAVRDPDFSTALWALDRAKGIDDWRAVADAAAAHPHASVRAEALRLRVARDGDAALPQVEVALFDRAQTVRLAASYLTRGRVDAIARWRAAADGTEERARVVGLCALAELALPDDRTRMLDALADSRPLVRAGALSALVRSNTGEVAPHVLAAIADPSPRVARVAFRLARKRYVRIPAELLDKRFKESLAAAARARVVANVDLAGKWEALMLLLAWCADASGDDSLMLRDALGHWLQSDASAQSPIPAGMLAPLKEAIERARIAWPQWRAWEVLAFALRTSYST
ncbi:hypothetical protein LVB87_08030 [Lysobacter sp. KIS68-7]|uniref:hypothetical protein n=1 Tax=Lysobacter sp. KIS68-7 TaxID=2904252 RepID=UPI001E2A348B|nr:hypothetical protein [Lysobacter sp. KIS68-7]UHQ18180.1 hypothetical protein LVB87_08030 [Lysobacter sp. KIS68-7]